MGGITYPVTCICNSYKGIIGDNCPDSRGQSPRERAVIIR